VKVDRGARREYRLKNRNIIAPPGITMGAEMAGRTITRADLSEVVYQKVGLSRTESAALVEMVLREVTDCLARGENVKLSSFGSFVVRQKGRRIGRNPKTGEEVPIEPRRVMVFKPSNILKNRINDRHDGKKR
jgi:integration host factor subunit alpha